MLFCPCGCVPPTLLSPEKPEAEARRTDAPGGPDKAASTPGRGSDPQTGQDKG